ncbi:hypothetical protein E2562_012025, partial [Oryza meyeriana var. granulata]
MAPCWRAARPGKVERRRQRDSYAARHRKMATIDVAGLEKGNGRRCRRGTVRRLR